MTPYVVLIPVCYLLGSVPFGLLVARIAKGIDVRSYGSGNTGMTNVLRTTGVAPGLAVLVLDLGKGVAAVFIARAIEPSPALEVTAALSALIGHNWSVFIRFQGGKGTATGLGTVFAISPAAVLIVVALSVPPMLVSRYVSLGSIMGATYSPCFHSSAGFPGADHSPGSVVPNLHLVSGHWDAHSAVQAPGEHSAHPKGPGAKNWREG